MLVRCVLMSCSGWVRQTGNISLSVIIRRISDDLALHAHASVVRVHRSTKSLPGRLALIHFEERVHLLGGSHLITKDTICSHIVWLVDVRAGSDSKATHALTTSHDSTSALALERRRLIDWATERVLALSWVRSADYLLRWFIHSCQSTWLVRLHLVLSEIRCWMLSYVIRSLIIF